MENLPEEVMTEILAKNKDRSLIFLRCWNNGGTHDDLISSHNPSPFTKNLETLKFNQFVGSCNGIICLAGNQSVYLYNPITREDKELSLNIPCDIYQHTGFGFDKSSNEYKVVRITEHVEVNRLSTDTWSTLDLNLKSKYYFLGDGVFLNGFCHWAVRPKSMCSKRVVTFDFQNETFGEMKYPGGRYDKHECIGVLDESLALCSSESAREFQVWVMTEYGKNESWTKKFSVRLSIEMRKIVGFWVHDMEIVLLGFSSRDKKRLVRCSSKERRCTTLFELHKDSYISGAVFKPTLLSL